MTTSGLAGRSRGLLRIRWGDRGRDDEPDRLHECRTWSSRTVSATGSLTVQHGHISAIEDTVHHSPEAIDLQGMYLAPGFVDLHVHGGDGADFMDGTAEAFRTVCRCHARHGTTSLTPTSTVARMDQYRCASSISAAPLARRRSRAARASSAAISTARISPARRKRLSSRSGFPDPLRPTSCRAVPGAAPGRAAVSSWTAAPEIASAEWLVRTYADRGARFNAGHSFATFTQMEAAPWAGECGTSTTSSARCPTGPGLRQNSDIPDASRGDGGDPLFRRPGPGGHPRCSAPTSPLSCSAFHTS